MTDQVKLENGKQRKLDRVTETYVKIRDARSELKRNYEAEDFKLKAQLETINGFLLQTLQELGVESIRTKHGTVYQSVSVKPNCQDWNSFYAFVKEYDAFDALEKRVKKSFITTYMEENSGDLPPGITVVQEYTVTVRRNS